ncbi:diguanylate cyclase domain-containing protein [Pseudanabaena sp. UWO310]|uniref:diguanylate cyclase domain-containing protein n=1 Tax=Pseudanabaena sp. UWO310 TaxID=2480795 RepID=UPI001157AD8F|nr:diguanylate cyclase [Pseudanabaena sp. UWO310]TYQ31079.1 diguanylate cyclase [Pseudanabaena sp. UWO310]
MNPNSPPESKGNILLIDDLPENLKLLTDLLTDLGYTVRSAISGSRAIKSVRAKLPNIILLDIQMPEMDGYQVCQTFKADPDLCDIPILFISALDETFDKLKAFQVGGVDYITKPFQIEEVVARLETHLTIQRQKKRLQDEIEKRKETELALQEANRKLELLANLDGLTQIANRRRFDDFLSLEWQHHKREQTHIALILIDIDYFKRYNDTYGHQGGDDCLHRVAQAIAKAAQRATDLVARYGGEEFAVILSGTDAKGALKVADAIQTAIANLAIPHQSSDVSDRVTLSMGIASLMPTSERSPQDLISCADQAMYAAKHQGRNRAIAFKVT